MFVHADWYLTMGNLFGKKKSRVTDHDKAVLQVKQQRDKLKQYQLRIEKKLETERLIAKKLLKNGQKERAKLLLKKKKYQEQLLKQTDGQLENLEKLIQDLEYSQIEVQVVNGLKVGNEALKKMNDILNIDEIERIMMETQEGFEKQKEISEMISGGLTAEDEEDVENEYEELMKLDEGETIVLPDVPIGEPEGREKVEKVQKMQERIALEAN